MEVIKKNDKKKILIIPVVFAVAGGKINGFHKDCTGVLNIIGMLLIR